MSTESVVSKSIFSGTTLAALVAVIVLPLVLPATTLASQILIFALATLACNLLLGFTGLLSFGQGMFFGAGAYIGALVMLHAGAGIIIALLVAALGCAIIAAIVGVLTIRRSGIYFVMLTLAFAQMAYFLAYTFSDWTGGENGLLDVPRPPISVGSLTLVDLSSSSSFYIFVAVIFMLVFVGAKRVVQSPLGTTLVAIRENEDRASAIGYNIGQFKLVAFILSGAVTGVAGVLYAMLLNFAPLSNIELSMSESILIMTIIGGTASMFGSLMGAASIVMLGEFLSPVWPRWMILLGAALIAISLYMRGGLWGVIESSLEVFRGRQENGEGKTSVSLENESKTKSASHE